MNIYILYIYPYRKILIIIHLYIHSYPNKFASTKQKTFFNKHQVGPLVDLFSTKKRHGEVLLGKSRALLGPFGRLTLLFHDLRGAINSNQNTMAATTSCLEIHGGGGSVFLGVKAVGRRVGVDIPHIKI